MAGPDRSSDAAVPYEPPRIDEDDAPVDEPCDESGTTTDPPVPRPDRR